MQVSDIDSDSEDEAETVTRFAIVVMPKEISIATQYLTLHFHARCPSLRYAGRSINCVQSGGSVAAALHVSSVTAYNLITTKTTVDSSETLHAVIMELTECIAKVCHYHKLNVQGSAEVMYDVCLRRCFTSDVKYVGGDDSDNNDSGNNEVNVWKMIDNEKFRCCGICCAMLASLRR